MLSQNIQDMLNEQINFELYSAYHYLALAAYFDSQNLPGFTSWMKAQAKEELFHMHKIFDYVHDRDGKVKLSAIGEPHAEYDSVLAAFESAYNHELKVSERINKLAASAHDEGDQMTNTFLQWFVTEQIEEEATVRTIVQQIKLAGQNGQGMFMIDRELGQRSSEAHEDES